MCGSPQWVIATTLFGVTETGDLTVSPASDETFNMPYILEAWAPIEQMPRLVWLEATGKDDEIRITFANALGVIAEGCAHAEELESFANSGGDCLCTSDLWVERTEVPHMWSVAVVPSPEAGQFRISAYDLTCGLQQIQLDRMLTTAGFGAAPLSEATNRPNPRAFGTHQVARGTAFDG